VKGSYVLIAKLPEPEIITIGKLTDAYFPSGYYAYVGSALGGVKARISRHLSQSKKQHWHIDYPLPKAAVTDIMRVAIHQAKICQGADKKRKGCVNCRLF